MIGSYSMLFEVDLNITTTTAIGSSNSSISSNNRSLNNGTGAATGSPPPAAAPAAATNTTSEILTLTPSQPFQRSATRSVSAHLLGDLVAYQQAPQLAGHFLLIPTLPGEQGACPAQPLASYPLRLFPCLPTLRRTAAYLAVGRRRP